MDSQSKRLGTAPRIRKTERKPDRSAEIVGSLVLGMLITLILLSAKLWLEKTAIGLTLEQVSTGLLQNRLAIAFRGRAVPIAVVDVTGLGQMTFDKSNEVETPRSGLLDVMRVVASADPKVIGVDIIFEPDKNGQLSAEDEGFLSASADLKGSRDQHIPVVVGISDSVVRGPKGWLGEGRFASLGGDVLVPRMEDGKPTERMFSKMIIPGEKGNISVPSLSYSLARAMEEEQSGRHSLGKALNLLLPSMIEQEWKVSQLSIGVREFEINFGALDELEDTTLSAVPIDNLSKRVGALTDKAVLIGKAAKHETNDQFVVPNRGDPVPGVYIHAAALDTLLREPLFRLTPPGRICTDLSVAFVLLGGVFVVEWRKRKAEFPHHEWVVPLSVFSLSLAIFLIAYFWIDSIGIFWTDFLLVIFSLLLHTPIERRLHRVLEPLWHGSLHYSAHDPDKQVPGSSSDRSRRSRNSEK